MCSEEENNLGATTSGSIISNGTPAYSKIVQGSRGSWGAGPGQATLADIVKSSTGLHGNAMVATSLASRITPQQPLYQSDAKFSSSADHEEHAYIDSTSTRSLDESGPLQESLERTSQIYPLNTHHHVDRQPSISDVKAVNAEIPFTAMPTSLSQELISPLGNSETSSSASADLTLQRSSIQDNQCSGRVSYQSQTTVSEKGVFLILITKFVLLSFSSDTF